MLGYHFGPEIMDPGSEVDYDCLVVLSGTLGVVCIYIYESVTEPHTSVVRYSRFKAYLEVGLFYQKRKRFHESEHALVMAVGRGVKYSSSSTDLIH